ncbi:glucokinase [Massilia terrae]|uniref:Glucokinase n=1 Tax=Massilia terrae TaxID=1811224 RepID=A0ABT2CT20_9BURK|nr:glucokinase [Massilia terrae]MCS0657137.1 glucokinase [Massilia terrae]
MNDAAFACPRLLADVGGTNARFAVETAPLQFEAVAVLACADYPSLGAAIQAYLGSVAARCSTPIRHAAIAIANPVDGDQVAMTNHHWSFSIAGLRDALGLATLAVVNDFTALAMALPQLGPAQRVQVGGGAAQAGRPIGLVGPGTGLGVSGLVPAGGAWIPLASEGGHASFAPGDVFEDAVVSQLRARFGHVSAERLLSGPGIELIHECLSGKALGAADITRRALDGDCPDCVRSIDVFCGALGSVAGNLALTLGATGGVFIGGGIVPRLGALFERSPFRARFEDKGRLSPYVARIPTWLIIEPYPAFFGASAILTGQLAEQH